MPVIPACGRQRLEDCEFKGYVRPCFKKQSKNKTISSLRSLASPRGNHETRHGLAIPRKSLSSDHDD
jgi:hypothetical protein